MSGWRPTDWEGRVDAIEPANCTKTETEYYHFLDGVEAGADAMLVALRGNGGRVAIEDSWASINIQIYKGSMGTLVFIPDKE